NSRGGGCGAFAASGSRPARAVRRPSSSRPATWRSGTSDRGGSWSRTPPPRARWARPPAPSRCARRSPRPARRPRRGPPPPRPPRDPYARPLEAADHDEYDAIVLCDAAPDAGDAVRGATQGGWIVFREVDFAGGAEGCLLSVASTEGGVLTLRLDDPLYGAVAG